MQLLRDLEILTSMAGSLLYTSFVPGIPSGLIRPPSSSSTTWHCRSYCRLLCFGYAFADHEDGVLQVMSRILEAHRMVHGEPLPALMLRGCVSSQLAGEGAAARGTSPLVLTHSHTCGCAAARAGLACWQNLWSAEAFVGRLVNVHVHLSQGLARIWRIFLSRSLSELQLSWRDIALHFSWKA